MDNLEKLLAQSAANHQRLCPRQVLGVRMGLTGVGLLEMEVPRTDKRLLVIVETDGCFVSGIEAATGCRVLHRTLRVEDYGKVAASFVDVNSGRAFRLAPRPGARELGFEIRPRCTRFLPGAAYGLSVNAGGQPVYSTSCAVKDAC